MTQGDPRDVVARGYDRIADQFAEWASRIDDPGREHWVARLDTLLPERARLLELGCGGANPSTKRLAARYELTGVDISAEQVRRARAAFPGAEIIHADLTRIDFPPNSFDAVVSVHALNHVPRDELGPLYRRAARWLRPDGILLVSTPTGDTAGVYEDEWLGARMFFSGWDEETNVRLVREAGFDVLDSDAPTLVEPELGAGRFRWILARCR